MVIFFDQMLPINIQKHLVFIRFQLKTSEQKSLCIALPRFFSQLALSLKVATPESRVSRWPHTRSFPSRPSVFLVSSCKNWTAKMQKGATQRAEESKVLREWKNPNEKLSVTQKAAVSILYYTNQISFSKISENYEAWAEEVLSKTCIRAKVKHNQNLSAGRNRGEHINFRFDLIWH